MIHSMTGFASTTITLTTPSATIQSHLTLKTLNNRFFDINCKLPYALTFLEPHIIRLCKASLYRGSVYFAIHLSNPHALKTEIVPSYTLAKEYVKAIQLIQQNLQLPGTVSISEFIMLPHLFEATEETDLSNNSTLLLHTIEQLLKTIVDARKQEGAALEQDLTERMHHIEKDIAQIEPRAHALIEQKKNHFLQEIESVLPELSSEIRESHLQTLYTTLEKMDIHEEIVRFKSHLENFRETIAHTEIQKGKKLDFILQEMFREINTMSAKLADAQSSSNIISIKVELEKSREQVQNIV